MKYQLPTADTGSGLLVPTYAELAAQSAAPAAPAAGKVRAYLDGNGGLQLLPAAGILGRRVAVHWGTVTAFPALAAAGDTCTRSDVGTAGSLWQYTGIASSGAGGWVTESPIVCTSTTRPAGAVLYDGLPIFQTDDKASATWDVANTVWHVWDTVTQAFTPGFTTAGGTPAVGNGVLLGFYRRMGRLCWIRVTMTFGSTTNGGTGSAAFTIPAAIAAAAGGQAGYVGEQWGINAKLFHPTGVNFMGIAWPSGTTLSPYLTGSATLANIGPLASASLAGSSGTGTPTIAGHFSIEPNGNLTIEGTYELAAG